MDVIDVTRTTYVTWLQIQILDVYSLLFRVVVSQIAEDMDLILPKDKEVALINPVDSSGAGATARRPLTTPTYLNERTDL
jgi:hypothetical protein